MQDKEIVNALTIIRDLGIKLGVKENELQKLQVLCKEKDVKFESEIAELRMQLETKDAAIAELRMHMGDLLRSGYKESDKDAAIAELREINVTLNSAYDNLSEKSTASIFNLTKKNEELQATIDQMLDSYQERADTSSAHIDSYEEDIERLQDEIHELRTEKQDMIAALQKIVSDLPSSSSNVVCTSEKKVEVPNSCSGVAGMMKFNLELFGLTDDVLKMIFSFGHTVITGSTVSNAVHN